MVGGVKDLPSTRRCNKLSLNYAEALAQFTDCNGGNGAGDSR